LYACHFVCVCVKEKNVFSMIGLSHLFDYSVTTRSSLS
jgi:hypothetical protein